MSGEMVRLQRERDEARAAHAAATAEAEVHPSFPLSPAQPNNLRTGQLTPCFVGNEPKTGGKQAARAWQEAQAEEHVASALHTAAAQQQTLVADKERVSASTLSHHTHSV